MVTSCDHLFTLRRGQWEAEVQREALGVALDGLIQGLGRHGVDVGEIRIDEDRLTANGENAALERCQSRRVRRHGKKFFWSAPEPQ